MEERLQNILTRAKSEPKRVISADIKSFIAYTGEELEYKGLSNWPKVTGQVCAGLPRKNLASEDTPVQWHIF